LSEVFEKPAADSAGVVIPPPLFFVAAFGLGGLVEHFDPWFLAATFSGERWVREAGLVVIALAIGLGIWAIASFRRAGTTPVPVKPTTAVVFAGPYRFTRNPMYLALTLALAGVGLALDRGWIALSALVGAALVDRYAIAREERYLERKFGDAYLAYKRRVRRWL
jgi:protein-S-isoprenylcysteine O-methyltransferase Ste14